MDLLKGVKSEIPSLKSGFALLLGGVGAMLTLIIMVACGNFYIYKLLLMPRHAPPPLLFFAAVLLYFTLLGYTLGLICEQMKRCKVLMALLFGIMTMVFSLLWYISFFKTAALIFGLFMLIMALLLTLMTVRESLKIGVLPTAFVGLWGFGLLFFLWLTFSAAILN